MTPTYGVKKGVRYRYYISAPLVQGQPQKAAKLSCAAQGYRETAVVLDADGVVIAVLRGDGTGAHTLDSAHDKAFTAGSFKNDTIALAERAKIASLSKLPHLLFFGRWCGRQDGRRGRRLDRGCWCPRCQAGRCLRSRRARKDTRAPPVTEQSPRRFVLALTASDDPKNSV